MAFHFECYVLERHDDEVTAEFLPFDPADGSQILQAEFDLSAFPAEDLPHLTPGAVFDCFSGPDGEPRVRWRNLGVWTQEEIDDIRRRAKAEAARFDELFD